MVRVEEEDETMRPCGCHAGRPCTCEMGKQRDSLTTFSCGICVNCRLNSRKGTQGRKSSMVPRRCLKSAVYVAELSFDKVILQDNCVFRMRKPDWNTNEKTAMYNKLHQMRLAMIQTYSTSLATIDIQKKLRTKYSSDLRKAQHSIQKLEEIKINTLPSSRKTTTEKLCVDSDVFDSFSKQLIDAETLVPNLRTRLEKANSTIATEKKNIKLIREYVQDFAVRKLQTSIRAFFRFHRWKKVLKAFHEDVHWSAAVEIQTIWRMFTATKHKLFLLQLRHDQAKAKAANVISRFFSKAIEPKCRRKLVFTEDTDAVFSARKQKVLEALFTNFGRSVLRKALARWREKTYEIRIWTLEKTVTSVILIQKVYRGFRVRAYLKRIRIRNSLTDRVGTLVDQFIVSGDFWGFILAIDADYRRFSHKIAGEEADAKTFMSTVLHQRKRDEERMMQDWFTASALDNPLVAGIDLVTKNYSNEEGHSSGSSFSQAMLHSAFVEDLVALSPNKKRDDLFPAEFPAPVIRQAMAKGFVLDEVVAVMRGLQAQGKEVSDMDLVLSTLQKRAPLMTNTWTSERVLREARRGDKVKISTKKPVSKTRSNVFISENLLDSIPGGMNAPIARLLLVAALRCYDPGSRSEKGTFVPCEGRNSHFFQSYLRMESPLVRIRSEQQAMEVVKPYLHILLENRCYTAYDILYNVRGIGELMSWNIPGPLAASIYSVIQEIHVQSTHISKRNIIKEVRISAGFEQFLKTRASNANETVVESATTPLNDTVLIQMQLRLETEVLGLPLHDVSIPVSELLFKAAFLVCGDIENPTSDTYQGFLHSLVTLRAAEDTEAMKQRIAARVSQAKVIAQEHTEVFRLFGVKTAGDLMHNKLVEVLVKDFTLQRKVSELIEPFGRPSNKFPSPRKQHPPNSNLTIPKTSKAISLSPIGKLAHGHK